MYGVVSSSRWCDINSWIYYLGAAAFLTNSADLCFIYSGSLFHIVGVRMLVLQHSETFLGFRSDMRSQQTLNLFSE